MKRLPRSVLGVLLTGALWVPAASFGENAPKRFEPEKHFPPEPLLYLSIHNVPRLKERLSGTLLGRIMTHPGWQRAFGGLGAKIKKQSEEVSNSMQALTGKTSAELLGLLTGEVALMVRGQGQPDSLAMEMGALAIELGDKADEILGVVSRLKSSFEEASGQKLEGEPIKGFDATVWPTPLGSIVHAVLGTHLVVASSHELFESIATAYSEGNKSQSIRPEMAKGLSVNNREILFLVDLAKARALLSPFLGMSPNAEDIQKALRVGGLESLTYFGYALGFRDGGMEGICHLGTRAEGPNALEALKKRLSPIGDVTEALTHMPASTQELQAGRMAPGGILKDLDELLREAFPEVGEKLDSLYQELEEKTSISFQKDLLALGDITSYSFNVDPPAGGLFWDSLALVKTESMVPYWKILLKLAAFLGAEVKTLECASGKVEYVNLTNGFLSREAPLTKILEGGWTPSFPELAILAISGVTISRAELGDGWTVLSTLPQAVVRHLEFYSKGQKLSEDKAMASLVKESCTGAVSASISRSGKSLLAAYNTLIPLANAFSPFLAFAGMDPAQLPPAELFQADLRPGFLRLTVGPDGFTLHGHRALESSSSGYLVAVAAGSMVGGFLVPTLLKGREAAYDVQCLNNLKTLYGYAIPYSDKSGKGAFPYSPEGSLAALQVLIDADPEIGPDAFVCTQGGQAKPRLEDGKVALTDETCSYELVPWKLKNTAGEAILIYDKTPCHHGKRNVLFVDGSVRAVEESEFQSKFEKDRQRFSKPAAGKKAKKRSEPAKE
jgi:prepilin-type processing-associated H-X9-DG protein